MVSYEVYLFFPFRPLQTIFLIIGRRPTDWMATVDDLQFEGTSFEYPPFMISLSVVKAMDFGWYTGTYIKEDYFRHLHKRMFATTGYSICLY